MGADGTACCRLAASSPHPSSMARRTLRRQAPAVGAVCPNRARTDLCGGCPAMGIPTAIGSFLCLLGTWMFASRRKEPPPSAQPFNSFWDIARLVVRALVVLQQDLAVCQDRAHRQVLSGLSESAALGVCDGPCDDEHVWIGSRRALNLTVS